jgi:hypothetical protein
MMDQYLRDAGGMNPLAMGEPIVGLFWRLQVSNLISAAPQKSQKSVQNLVSQAVEFKPGPKPADELVPRRRAV